MTIDAVFTAAGAAMKVFLAIFGARNSPAMQANKQADTIQKIHDSVQEHIQDGDLAAVQTDAS